MSESNAVISVEALQAWLPRNAALRVLDARSDPVNGSDPGAGRRAWFAGHLPGAVHADLDEDLSDHRKRGQGRHPLPDCATFAGTLGRWGIAPETDVVIYDAADGSLAAARAWWLLRLIGHARVWVLDGGLAAWRQAGGAIEMAEPQIAAFDPYPGEFDRHAWLDSDQIHARLDEAPGWLLDARSAERYAGVVEPIDPVAGHVPGALNLPFAALVADGCLRSPEAIAAEVLARTGREQMHGAVVMCGSGVTACHLLLALEHAGLSGAKLYPGSWSGWIADSSRPVARD